MSLAISSIDNNRVVLNNNSIIGYVYSLSLAISSVDNRVVPIIILLLAVYFHCHSQ